MAIQQSQLYNNVPDERIEYNSYDLGYDNTLTLEAGRLVVLFCRRVLPGEKWRVGMDAFLRTQPLQTPILGKMDFFAHAFFVRTGSISDSWNDYIRGGEDGEGVNADGTPMRPDLLGFNDDGIVDLRNAIPIEALNYLNASLGVDVTQSQTDNNQIRPFFAHGSLSDDFNLGSVSYDYNENGFNSDTAEYSYMRPFETDLCRFKGYQAIWSEYYADANIQTFGDIDTIEWEWMKPLHYLYYDFASQDWIAEYKEGYTAQYDANLIAQQLLSRRYRCYAKDYFTSALPEPQRGPDVKIPLDADISILNNYSSLDPTNLRQLGSNQQNSFLGIDDNNSQNERNLAYGIYDRDGFLKSGDVALFNAQNLRIEISKLNATITDLRTAVALQEFYEASARYGNRYKEYIYGHFGSMIPDDQLTRPWYLGGMKMPIQISEVLQTSPDSNGNGVGDMYGKGLSAGDAFLFEREFSDYGYVMVVGSIRPRNYYKNTIQKEFYITDRLDEFHRKLQAVGEQEVKVHEICGNFYDSEVAVEHSDDVFGYQMRYSEYKSSNDEIHGDFKGNLSSWTIFRDFSGGAALNSDFLEVKPQDINHIFQYTGNDSDHFMLQCHFNVERDTGMEVYSIPRIN